MGYDLNKKAEEWTLDECGDYLNENLIKPKNKKAAAKYRGVISKYKTYTETFDFYTLIDYISANTGKDKEIFKNEDMIEIISGLLKSKSKNVSYGKIKSLESKYGGFNQEFLNVIDSILENKIEARKKVRTLSFEDIIGSKENMANVPSTVRDPQGADFEDSMKNTGIYLWSKGYNVEKYLGRGSFGVVWKIGNKAIKVARSNAGKDWEDEVITLKELDELFKNDEKAKKYLNISKATSDERVVEADLANEDVHQNQSKKGALKADKTIASALRKSKHALKAVKLLHDKGYAHNDIKPTNMLKIQKNSGKISKLDNKKHKNKLQLTDFGQMTKFNEKPKPGSKGFLAPDWTKYDEKDLCPEAKDSISAKRDVYALGMTFLFFLFGRCYKFDEITRMSTEFKKGNKVSKIYDDYIGSKGIYNGTSKENFVKYLKVIKKMLKPNCTQRISVEEALKLIRNIKP